MSKDIQGVAADAAGLSPSVEPVPVSPPDGASIPNAGQWAVLSGRWGYEAVLIAVVTPKLIKHNSGYGRRLRQSPRDSIVALFDTEEPAKQLVQAIDGARDRFKTQRREENARHDAVMVGIRERQDAAVQRVIDAALAKVRGQ